MIENLENESALKTEGEALMLLVRRSGMKGVEAARALGIKPESLSRMYQRQRLTEKVKVAASKVFGVPLSYFLAARPAPLTTASEPSAPYTTALDRAAALEKENQLLRDEPEEMRRRLVEEKLISDDLSEKLRQVTKRD